MAENITWLKESLEGEEDAGRRSDAELLLGVASKLAKQPSNNVLRQIAKDLHVHQKDRRMTELYDAVQARVRDRVDELRKQSHERRTKTPRKEAVAECGIPASSSDAGQFAARSVLKRESPPPPKKKTASGRKRCCTACCIKRR